MSKHERFARKLIEIYKIEHDKNFKTPSVEKTMETIRNDPDTIIEFLINTVEHLEDNLYTMNEVR